MADVFRNILIGTVLTCLFIFLIVGFAIDIGNDYGKDVGDLTDDKINFTGVQDTLDSAQDTAETWKESFASQNIFSLVAGIVVTGIFKLAITMYKFLITPFTLLMDIMNNVLNVPEIVTNVVIFGLIVVIIFGIWRLLKQGD